MNFWNWKIWISLLFMALYEYIFFLWNFFGISYKDPIYDLLQPKKFRCKSFVIKNLTQNKLWTFENFEMNFFDNHFW